MSRTVEPDRRPAAAKTHAGSSATPARKVVDPEIGARAAPDDALETSRLLLELVHVIYATRAAEAETAAGTDERPDGPARDGVHVERLHASGEARVAPPRNELPAHRDAPSTHAIRAAVHVHQHGGRTIGQLAEGLGISYGWASRVVTELETGGLVDRHVDPSDRRVVHVLLTPEAADMVERTYRWRGEAVQRALAGLSSAQRDGVRAFLRSVTEELARTGREHQG